MVNVNPVGIPMDPNIKIFPNPDINRFNRSNSYAKLLGSLQYLANSTRPDISYAINKLALYTTNPSLQHHSAIKQILRYLAGMTTLGITYHNSQYGNKDENLFHGYADAAFANADDEKSTTGYVFLAAGGSITWKSKKQSIIALSTTESEYIALSEAGREACWLRNLYEELRFPQKYATIIKGDNEGSVILTCNPQFHHCTKHIATRHHWIRDLVCDQELNIQNCHDPKQTTDILTKALPKPKFIWHRGEMGLNPLKELQ
jgi:hypothetical protein